MTTATATKPSPTLDRQAALGRGVAYLDREFLGRQRLIIAGAGAVGSTLFDLCLRQGVGTLGLIDYDKVEAHNAATGIFDRRDLDKLKVDALKERAVAGHGLAAHRVVAHDLPVQLVGLGFFLDHDAGVIAVDNVMSRVNVNRKLIRAGIIGVDLGIDLANGRFTHTSPQGPCFECRLDAAAYHGWDASFPCAGRKGQDAPTIAAGSASYLTAGAALNTLLQRLERLQAGAEDPHLGKEFVITGGGSFLYSYEIGADHCRALHMPLDRARLQPHPWRSEDICLAQVLEHARREVGRDASLRLEETVVLRCRCGCAHQRPTQTTLSFLQGRRPRCPSCGERGVPRPLETISIVGPGSDPPPWVTKRPLAEIGFPRNHVFTAVGQDGETLHLQVSGDATEKR